MLLNCEIIHEKFFPFISSSTTLLLSSLKEIRGIIVPQSSQTEERPYQKMHKYASDAHTFPSVILVELLDINRNKEI